MAVAHASFTVSRTYTKSPAVVFRAFSDPARKRRWFAEGEGSTVEDFTTDFLVGGSERTSFRMTEPPMAGTVITNDTVFMDIVPDQRIVLTYSMSIHGAPMSVSLATFQFEPVDGGTRLTMTEQGCFFDNADGPVMREEGWGELLDALGREVTG